MEYQNVDHHDVVRKNRQKTTIIIFITYCILFLLGTFIDFLIQIFFYPETYHIVMSQHQYFSLYINQATPIMQSFFAYTLNVLLINPNVLIDLTPYAMMASFLITFLFLMYSYKKVEKIMMMGLNYKECTENDDDPDARLLFQVTEQMRLSAGMSHRPKIYLIEDNFMNAFASGVSEKNSMVAATRVLVQDLEKLELQAVMAHEISHIKHEDIKLNITFSTLSNILLLQIEVIYFILLLFRGKNSKNNNTALLFILIFIYLIRYLLPIFSMLLSLFMSRKREFMADAGAVSLMQNPEPMARALIKIDEYYKQAGNPKTNGEFMRETSYLYNPPKFSGLLSTHPKTEDRLKSIGFTRKSKG